jgi:glycopeptide antibiotics resistance protein
MLIVFVVFIPFGNWVWFTQKKKKKIKDQISLGFFFFCLLNLPHDPVFFTIHILPVL